MPISNAIKNYSFSANRHAPDIRLDVMRAVFVRDSGGTEALSLDCTPEPIPGPDDVVVDVQATAENFGDLLVIDEKYQFFPPLPFIPRKLPTGKIASIG